MLVLKKLIPPLLNFKEIKHWFVLLVCVIHPAFACWHGGMEMIAKSNIPQPPALALALAKGKG